MATQEEVQAVLNRVTAAVKAAREGITEEISQLRSALEQLNANETLTQEQLDQLEDVAEGLEAAAADLAADDVTSPTSPTPPTPPPAA